MSFLGFHIGDDVEVIGHDPGLIGAHMNATIRGFDHRWDIIRVAYRHIREDDSGCPLEEMVSTLNVRPLQPYHEQAVFLYGEHVDVWYRKHWWYGTIERSLGSGWYEVEFSNFRYPPKIGGRLIGTYHIIALQICDRETSHKRKPNIGSYG